MVKQIKVADIKHTFASYPRDNRNDEVIGEYAEALEGGASFPPIVVFCDDAGTLHLADGRHRLQAHRKLERERISATIRKGDKRDALIYAVGANDKHGCRRTEADKAKAVELVLKDKILRKRSINSIAKMCGVSWATVRTAWVDLELPERVFDESEADKVATTRAKSPRSTSKEPRYAIPALSRMLEHADEARSWLPKELTGMSAAKKKAAIKQVNTFYDSIHKFIGEVAGSKLRITDCEQPLNVYQFERSSGIFTNNEFAKKGMCSHSVSVGLGCGNQCTYCSTAVMLRTHPFFQDIEQTSFTRGKAIVDPESATRLKDSIKNNKGPKITDEHIILFSNIDDGWSPEAQKYELGKKVMTVLLENTEAKVRILTKGEDVETCFGLFDDYKDRVIVGLSTGIPKSKSALGKIIEPNAATITDRLRVLKAAYDRGLQTYGMLCPCLPGIADTQPALKEMFKSVLACGAKDIWLEPVNPRGRAMKNTANALARAKQYDLAQKMLDITSSRKWSKYTVQLIENAIAVAGELGVKAGKPDGEEGLRILLYPSHLLQEDEEKLRSLPGGEAIIWL